MTSGIFTAAGRRLRLGLAAAAVLAAAGCGGGDTVDSFDPRRLIVFGDEASVLSGTPAAVPGPAASQPAPIGSKYSVNTLDTEETDTSPAEDLEPKAGDPANLGAAYGNCVSGRLWIQNLADEYGFGFEQCKDDKPVRAFTFAEPGAKVAGVKAQIDAFLQSDSFSSRDLVAIYVGTNDIHEIYLGVTSASQCKYDPSDPDSSGSAARAARQRGSNLADQVKRVADNGSGGRTLFITVLNQGDTPFARNENRIHSDFDRRDCLENLTDAFNGGLRADGPTDGRIAGLVAFAEDDAAVILDNPDDFDYDNAVDAACTTPAPDDAAQPGVRADLPALLKCTTANRKEDAKSHRYFWAGPLNFGIDIHDELGDAAVRRADRNPF